MELEVVREVIESNPVIVFECEVKPLPFFPDLQLNAFSFGAAGPTSEQQTIPVLIYFSLTTLSTIGFGDITPLTLQARYAAVAEGITGQFYLAILVARLVGYADVPISESPTENQHRRFQNQSVIPGALSSRWYCTKVQYPVASHRNIYFTAD